MDEELKNMLVKLMEGQEAMKIDISDIKRDVSKLGAKLDGEVSDKLKILAEEQSIMRKDILDIKYQQQADKQILLDIKLSTDVLNRNQKTQESKIIELDKKIAK